MKCFTIDIRSSLLVLLVLFVTTACQKDSEWRSAPAFSLSDEDTTFPHMASHIEMSQDEITGVGRPDYQAPEEDEVQETPEQEGALEEVERILGYTLDSDQEEDGSFGFSNGSRRKMYPTRIVQGNQRSGPTKPKYSQPTKKYSEPTKKKTEAKNNVMDSVYGPR